MARGRLLRELPALAAAAGRGEVSGEQIGVIGRLAARVGVGVVREVDEILAALAAQVGPAELDKACERVRAHADPDGPDPDPDADFDRRGITIGRQDRMVFIRGQLDPETGASLLTALDALRKPPAAGDARTAAQRRADALGQLAGDALVAGRLPTVGGVRPQLGILITPQTLLRDPDSDAAPRPRWPWPQPPPDEAQTAPPGPSPADPLAAAGIPPRPEPAWLDWIGEIPTALAQRLACDAEVWRAVLDPATGLPLELGRSQRLVPAWLRKALHARDRGCRWPGCDAPSAWSDAHHLLPWYLGGPTDIDNLLMMCRWHHRLVHEGQWQISFDHSTGEVSVTRPDGLPYQIRPSRPWTGPATQRGDTALPHAA